MTWICNQVNNDSLVDKYICTVLRSFGFFICQYVLEYGHINSEDQDAFKMT